MRNIRSLAVPALLVALVAPLVAGCATGPTREQVLASLVGQPESQALRVLGAPNHVLDANGRRFLAYDDQQLGYAPVPFGPFGPFGYGWYGPASVPVVRSCVMTVEIAAGRVASWNLRGDAC